MKKLAIVVLMLAVLTLAGCSNQVEKRVTSNPPPPGEVRVEDGKQVVTLSWGKFNYNPEVIRVKVDQPVKIVADMDRLTGCFRSFEVPGLGIDESFSERHNFIEFTPKKAGTFNFVCAMGMGRGTLVVE